MSPEPPSASVWVVNVWDYIFIPSGNKSAIENTNKSTNERHTNISMLVLAFNLPQIHNDIDSKHPLQPLSQVPFSRELLQVRQVPVACSLTCHTPGSRDECGSCLGGYSGYFGLPSIHPSSATAYSAIRVPGWPLPNMTWYLTSQQPPLASVVLHRTKYFPPVKSQNGYGEQKMPLHPPSTQRQVENRRNFNSGQNCAFKRAAVRAQNT